MAQTYSLWRVKMFLQRIKEEKERTESLLAKVRANSDDYVPESMGVCLAEIGLCEAILKFAELHFGDDVKEELMGGIDTGRY